MLEPLGFDLHAALDGRDALARCADWRPNLVLLDLRMPVMDGIEATRALRADPATRQTPVVAVTAAAFGKDRASALRAGASAHLVKPLLRSELLSTLASLLPEMAGYAKIEAGGTIVALAFGDAVVRFLLIELCSWIPGAAWRFGACVGGCGLSASDRRSRAAQQHRPCPGAAGLLRARSVRW
jgi:CheY-like chemotaxis protein